MKKQFILIGSMLLMLLASPAWADAAMPSNNINLDGLLNTVWVAGDYRPVAEVFNSIGMFFSGGEKSIWRGLLFLGAIIGLTMAITRLAFGGKMADIGQWLMATVIMSMFFLPRTDVKIASYYTASSGNQAGAVAFRKVDNIPIGLVLPLALTTNIGKSITELYDTSFQVLPNALTNSAAAAGNSYSFMYRGQEGFFSPLKLALKTVNYYPSDPLFAKNMNAAMSSCNWRQRTPDFAKYGAFGLLMPDDKSKNSGMTNWTYRDAEGRYVTDQIFCNAAGYLLSLQVLSDFAPNADGSSYMSSVLASTQSLNVADKGSPDMTQVSKKIATELAVLPELVAGAINGGSGAEEMNPARLKALQEHVLNQKGMGNIPDTYRTFIASREVNATFVKASMAFNRLVANCLNAKDEYSCAQETSIMFDAGQNALVQSAGEASMFQRFSTGTQNILLVVYIAMSPIIMFMIMLMGVKGIKLAGSYLMFCIWIASWMPLTNVIASYMMKNYISNIEAIGATLRGDPARILSPAVLQNIMQSTGDMIASASSMMAYVPTIMLTLLSGSIYGMVSLAQRASMTGKDYIDETKTTPNLESSRSLNVAGREEQELVQNSGRPSSTGHLRSLDSLSRTDIDGTGKINFGFSQQEQETLTEQYREQQSLTEEARAAYMDKKGFSHVVGADEKFGWVRNETGGFRIASGDELAKARTEGNAFSLYAGLRTTGVPFLDAGGKGSSDSQVTFKNGNSVITGKEAADLIQSGKGGNVTVNGQKVDESSATKSLSTYYSDMKSREESLSKAHSATQGISNDFSLSRGNIRDLINTAEYTHKDGFFGIKQAMYNRALDEKASDEYLEALKSSKSTDDLTNTVMSEFSKQHAQGNRQLSNAAMQSLGAIVSDNPNQQDLMSQINKMDVISDNTSGLNAKAKNLVDEVNTSVDGGMGSVNSAHSNYRGMANTSNAAQQQQNLVETQTSKTNNVSEQVKGMKASNAGEKINMQNGFDKAENNNPANSVRYVSEQLGAAANAAHKGEYGEAKNHLAQAGNKVLNAVGEVGAYTPGSIALDVAKNAGKGVANAVKPKASAPTTPSNQSSTVTGAVKDNFGQSFLSALRNTRSSSSQVPYRLPESGDNVSSNISNGGNRIYSGVQSVGATRHYIRHDGTLETRTGGSRAWRNNNPGNLEYGALAKKHGAIGHDGRFAIFPSKEAGDNARRDLIFRGKNYKNLNLFQAIKRYAPASENNTNFYYQAVKSAVGSNKQMKDYTPQEQQKIIDAMNRVEGNKAGKVVLSRSKTSRNNRA